MSVVNKFHCCATCVNYEVVRDEHKISYKCSRLGYDTKPTYQFNCWEPKENVKRLMNKRSAD